MMKQTFKFCFLAFAILTFSLPLHAADNAGAFLEQTLGPKATGLGMAFTSIADNTDAIFVNPAGLKTHEVNVMTYQAFETNFQSIGYVFPLMGFNLGIGYIHAGVDNIEETVFDSGLNQFVPTGKTFGYAASGIFLGAGLPINDRLSVGSSIKLIDEKLKDNKASGFGLDVGILYSLDPIFLEEDISIGITAKNIISPELEWDTLSKTTSSLPLTLNLGASSRFLAKTLLLAVEVQKKGPRSPTLHFGGEYLIHPSLPIRAGYNDGSIVFGAGLIIDRLTLDYSLTILNDAASEVEDNISRFAIGFRL